MKILYYDCFAGISGDMNLAALIDLGVSADYLLQELQKLHLEGYHIDITNTLKMGISGTRVDVLPDTVSHEHHHDQNHEEHDHKPRHEHHHHSHQTTTTAGYDSAKPVQETWEKHKETDSHDHRNLAVITEIIENSSLNTFVKEKSLAVFHEIAVAEAKIHAKSTDEIHFHEVGAIDSIIDIVGAAICIDFLKPDRIMASTIELGGGFVNCAHGVFPVPAPATTEILKNIPVKKGAVNKETTTPTGAAILKIFVDEFADRTDFLIQKTAYGIGHRDLEIPNVLRVFVGEKQEKGDFQQAPALLLECNIDDMNPEHYDYIMEKLLKAGAQDVFLVPIIMKKSRPAVQLKVLCDISLKSEIEKILLTETTSLGVRHHAVIKTMLDRKSTTLSTQYGPIRIKEAVVSGKTVKFKAEYDDCIRAAEKYKVNLQEVYREVEKCFSNRKSEE